MIEPGAEGRRGTPMLLLAFALAGVAVAAAGAWVTVAGPELGTAEARLALGVLVAGTLLAVALGLTIVTRAGHGVGWALLALAVAVGLGAGAGRDLAAAIEGCFLRWAQTWAPIVAAAAFEMIALLFPDGRLLARRRAVAIATLAGAAVATAGVILRTGSADTAFGMGASFRQPNIAGTGGLDAIARSLVVAGSFALGVAGVAALAILARRARIASGPERASMLWVLVPMVTFAAAIALAVGFGAAGVGPSVST